MKLKKLFMTLLLSLGVVAGAAAGVSATVLNETKEPQVAEAATISQNTMLYLKPSSNWKQSSARFAVYLFGGSGNQWYSMSQISNTGIYAVQIDQSSTHNNVIFCRMNPGDSYNSWDTKWNQTSDLTFNGTNNYYTVKENTWDKGGGTWSVYNMDLYVIGTLNDWSINDEYKFEVKEDKKRELLLDLEENDEIKLTNDINYSFQINKNSNNGFKSNNITTLTEGNDNNLKIEKSGYYKITLEENFVLTYVATIDLVHSHIDAVNSFIDNYMNFNNIGHEEGKTSETENCLKLYDSAKAAYNALRDKERILFCTSTDSKISQARERLTSWATIKGDTFDSSGAKLASLSRLNRIYGNTDIAPIIILVIGSMSFIFVAMILLKKKIK